MSEGISTTILGAIPGNSLTVRQLDADLVAATSVSSGRIEVKVGFTKDWHHYKPQATVYALNGFDPLDDESVKELRHLLSSLKAHCEKINYSLCYLTAENVPVKGILYKLAIPELDPAEVAV